MLPTTARKGLLSVTSLSATSDDHKSPAASPDCQPTVMLQVIDPNFEQYIPFIGKAILPYKFWDKIWGVTPTQLIINRTKEVSTSFLVLVPVPWS